MPVPTDETHFVVRIVIERVRKVTTPERNYDKVPGDRDKVDRDVTELANIVVKDTDMASLKSKTIAHVDLVDDLG